MDKQGLEGFFSRALTALIEHNGGSMEQALDDMKITNIYDRKSIKGFYGWDEDEDYTDDEEDLPDEDTDDEFEDENTHCDYRILIQDKYDYEKAIELLDHNGIDYEEL